MPESERLAAYFSGHVQGVGFRFTAIRIARSFPNVTGFVRNLPDGRVELVAQGPRTDLDGFVHQLMKAMGSYIRNVETGYGAESAKLRGFTIR